MSSWSAMMDENRFRLRASCNACNESKVRCSQRKPTCARCERNGTECIYGLSRRTHKDAPPISILQSQRGARVSRSGRPRLQLPSSGDTSTSTSTSTSTNSNSTSNIATPSNGCATSDESAGAHNNNANLFSDYMFPTATGSDTLSMHRAAQLVTGITGITGITGSTNSTAMAPRHFSTTEAESGAEYANANPWALGSLFGANHIPNSDTTDMATFWARNGEGECTCHAGVTELLASIRGGGGGGGGGSSGSSSSSSSSSSSDQRLSLDAQLAKLKRCIVSSETSMGCAHGREDSEPIHIMAVAMLIGYVIDDFKMLARSSALSSSAATPSSTNMSLGGLLEPRLSWGVLELEDDDEMDLRQRLYLLSFRKLERLLSQLTLYLRDLHNARASLPDPSRHMAFVIACDYTRLWLEKKAEDVKRLFSVPFRDETMDSALA
ncbi:hypothetical protein CC78DRAFT_336613 [Lojkania enalia]|uniref:Zn(2)-C6 fungal-type domain-containing protein n=1 Tax=Lojkania enalia TaxID=147567 RepID=A0A9P4K6K8_9PLEO|nr:hypothetical protein CC78DRAFT_336613 [Didymosphaeria enalia]